MEAEHADVEGEVRSEVEPRALRAQEGQLRQLHGARAEAVPRRK